MDLNLIYQYLKQIQINLKRDGYINKELILFIIYDIELNKNILFVFLDKNKYTYQENDDYIAFPLHYIASEYQIKSDDTLENILNYTKIKPIKWDDFYSDKKKLIYLTLEKGAGELYEVLF